MGQRVNLQYTIDIDDLPEETKKLIVKAYGPLNDVTTYLDDIKECKSALTVDALGCIDEARQSLMNVDYILQDIQNIVKGYLAHVSSTNDNSDTEAPAQTPSEDLYGLPTGFNMDELQNKLSDFKQTYDDLNSTENEKPDQEQNA